MALGRPIVSFTDLTTWQNAHLLALSIYGLTKKFPADEKFGITSQMRRSAVSVTSNISEGFGRYTFKNKVHFYYQARGSLSELYNQLILSRDLGYINTSDFVEIEKNLEQSERLLQKLILTTKNNDKFNK